MMNDQEPPVRGSIQAKDPFSKAPPGYSLTRVNSQWNWGKPPLDVDPEVVLDKAIRSLNKPSVKEEMLKLMLGGVSIEVMIEGYILQGFHDGRFTPDVGLLIKPPLAIVMANMAANRCNCALLVVVPRVRAPAKLIRVSAAERSAVVREVCLGGVDTGIIFGCHTDVVHTG